MHWLQHKNLSSLRGPILGKINKKHQKCPFFKNAIFWQFFLFFSSKWDFIKTWSFLCCNQSIQTLYLSYKTALKDYFHFLPYNGGFAFADPWYGRQKFSLEKKKKTIFIYKTTPRNIWGSNLFPLLRKIEELVLPPY